MATTDPAPMPENARVILIFVRTFDLGADDRSHRLSSEQQVYKSKAAKVTHITPSHVAQLAATILDTAERRLPHRYIGLLPYTLEKGTTRRGPKPAKII